MEHFVPSWTWGKLWVRASRGYCYLSVFFSVLEYSHYQFQVHSMEVRHLCSLRSDFRPVGLAPTCYRT